MEIKRQTKINILNRYDPLIIMKKTNGIKISELKTLFKNSFFIIFF